MKKASSHADVLSKHLSFCGKTAVDVGCGTGDFVRWLTKQGAKVIGIDTETMIGKAMAIPHVGDEIYRVGTAENLPVEKECADAVVCMASLHHVPEAEMPRAFENFRDVLKSNGKAVFVEPVAQKGAYTEITYLVEDEARIQAAAYKAIWEATRSGFVMRKEEIYFLERSFEDYVNLLGTFVDDPGRRSEILEVARGVTLEFGRKAGVSFEDFRYRSICRLNILENAGL